MFSICSIHSRDVHLDWIHVLAVDNKIKCVYVYIYIYMLSIYIMIKDRNLLGNSLSCLCSQQFYSFHFYPKTLIFLS